MKLSRKEGIRQWQLAFVAFATAATAAAVSAQSSVELSPFVGSYLPLTDFGSSVRPATPALPGATSDYRETIGVLAGAGLRFNTSPTFGFELLGAYAKTGWTESQTSEAPGAYNAGYSIPGHVVQGEFRAILRPRRTNLQLLGGISVLQRGGRAWDEDQWVPGTKYNKSNVAGVVGVGARAFATQRLGFDINAELHLYSVDKVDQGFVLSNVNALESKSFQTDLQMTVGVPIKLWSR